MLRNGKSHSIFLKSLYDETVVKNMQAFKEEN